MIDPDALDEAVEYEAEEQADSSQQSAEVVLIMTSLGSVRRYYFNSLRTKHLLDTKGYIYYVVDANKDVSQGADLLDAQLLNTWKSEARLLPDTSKPDESLLLPQLLLDGVAVSETELRDLEEDGDLDYIYSRLSCPSCLEERDPAHSQCPSCGKAFGTVIPPDWVYSGKILQWCRGQVLGTNADGYFEHPTFQRAKSIRDGTKRVGSYEELFGEE
eukprot:GHVO01052067.1.p1 GENE.GHVO01052067.1~~GHVO01052067.1.p1  ORF type:complete len:216 (+),score=41.59 GHVO01052067.1:623-1270(+)